MMATGQRQLCPKHRLDTRFSGRLGKTYSAIEGVMIGQGQRRHIQTGSAGDQGFWMISPIQQAKIGMAVKFNVSHQSYNRCRYH